MNEEVTIGEIATLLNVSHKSASQRMWRLVQKHDAVKLNWPMRGVPSRFKLLVPKESLLKTKKFMRPNMSREVDWKRFCSDPFGMAGGAK